MPPIRIVAVSPKTQPDGTTLYRIRDEHGERYATTDAMKASVCQRAMELDRPVTVLSGPGWFYRELDWVQLVPNAEAPLGHVQR